MLLPRSGGPGQAQLLEQAWRKWAASTALRPAPHHLPAQLQLLRDLLILLSHTSTVALPHRRRPGDLGALHQVRGAAPSLPACLMSSILSHHHPSPLAPNNTEFNRNYERGCAQQSHRKQLYYATASTCPDLPHPPSLTCLHLPCLATAAAATTGMMMGWQSMFLLAVAAVLLQLAAGQEGQAVGTAVHFTQVPYHVLHLVLHGDNTSRKY